MRGVKVRLHIFNIKRKKSITIFVVETVTVIFGRIHFHYWFHTHLIIKKKYSSQQQRLFRRFKIQQKMGHSGPQFIYFLCYVDICVARCVSSVSAVMCVCQYFDCLHAFPGKKEKKGGNVYLLNDFLRSECLLPPQTPCIHSRHCTERETGGNSGLFNFLTFRHDWICSAAKPDKRLLKAKSQLMTWPSCSHGQRKEGGNKREKEREREREREREQSCHAQHLFIQTVHLLCGLSLAGIQHTHTHTQTLLSSSFTHRHIVQKTRGS